MLTFKLEFKTRINMNGKNLIIICIDGGRLDRALKSKVFKHLAAKGVFFPQTITYAPYTNSAIYALISGSYGNRNGCFSYWHSIKFEWRCFKSTKLSSNTSNSSNSEFGNTRSEGISAYV